MCQGCFIGVSRVLEGSHKVVKGHYTGISRMSYKNVTNAIICYIMLQLCYMGVTWASKVFLGCNQDVTWVFQWSDMQVCHIRSDMSRVTSQE